MNTKISLSPDNSQCPIPHEKIWKAFSILGRIVARIKWPKGVLNNQKEEDYTRYALLIKEFYSLYGEDLDSRLDWIFEQEMNREEYCMAIYQHITSLLWARANETYNMDYGRLNSWIGTMILILFGLFHHRSHISEVECIRFCEDIMRNIPISRLPDSNSKNKKIAYRDFIGQYLKWRRLLETEIIPDKLFCPAKYTPEWNKFVRQIIWAIFRHF